MPFRLGYIFIKVTVDNISKCQPRVTVSVTNFLTNAIITYDPIAKGAKDLKTQGTHISTYIKRKHIKPINKKYVITKLYRTYLTGKIVKVVES